MKSSNILYYVLALFLPIILFTVVLNNYNETHPVVTYLVCMFLFLIAGWQTSKNLAFTAWSVVVGIVEATLLYFMA
jgi:VIT1/CCC1 family predicted Fe2+/Mn2+ transporter